MYHLITPKSPHSLFPKFSKAVISVSAKREIGNQGHKNNLKVAVWQ